MRSTTGLSVTQVTGRTGSSDMRSGRKKKLATAARPLRLQERTSDTRRRMASAGARGQARRRGEERHRPDCCDIPLLAGRKTRSKPGQAPGAAGSVCHPPTGGVNEAVVAPVVYFCAPKTFL